MRRKKQKMHPAKSKKRSTEHPHDIYWQEEKAKLLSLPDAEFFERYLALRGRWIPDPKWLHPHKPRPFLKSLKAEESFREKGTLNESEKRAMLGQIADPFLMFKTLDWDPYETLKQRP